MSLHAGFQIPALFIFWTNVSTMKISRKIWDFQSGWGKISNIVIFRQLKIADNFIKENVEKLLIETLDKNYQLVKLDLRENRLSNACF